MGIKYRSHYHGGRFNIGAGYSKKANLKMLKFKRSRNKLRKIKLQNSVLMSKERYGT
jgi:hypothetical protein